MKLIEFFLNWMKKYDDAVAEMEEVQTEAEEYLHKQKTFFGSKVTYVGTEKKRFQLEVTSLMAPQLFAFSRPNLSEFRFFTSKFFRILLFHVQIFQNFGFSRPNFSEFRFFTSKFVLNCFSGQKLSEFRLIGQN